MAWRLCYIVPLTMHIVGALFGFTARDLPDGTACKCDGMWPLAGVCILLGMPLCRVSGARVHSWLLCSADAVPAPLPHSRCLALIPLPVTVPPGNISELEKSGAKQKSKGSIVLKTGLSNVNAWILTATYGMCFGVELTMNSVAALYFHECRAE